MTLTASDEKRLDEDGNSWIIRSGVEVGLNGHTVDIYELIDCPERYRGPFGYTCQGADGHSDEGFTTALEAEDNADAYHRDPEEWADEYYFGDED